MRYLKLFENKSIENICKHYNITNYHIHPDGTIDVDGHVNFNLGYKELNKIPLKFGTISGYFSCRRNNLRNLIGSPRRVGDSFDCDINNLTSLEGAPIYIGGDFWCMDNNNLWSMDYFPRHAKAIYLFGTPIESIFNLFRTPYLEDGGKFFSTSGTLMDFFWDCDPVWPGGVIKKRRMNNFLASIEVELKLEDIEDLKSCGWKIED